MEPLAALDNRYTQLLLQLADAPRQRRLRDVANLRRPREMLLARQRGEILQLPDVHRRAPLGNIESTIFRRDLIDTAYCSIAVVDGGYQQRGGLTQLANTSVVPSLTEAGCPQESRRRTYYAMLMILARLGLRAPEAIAIELDDIDWRAGTILIRGKGKRHDRMPLPEGAPGGNRRLHTQGRRGSSRTRVVSNKPPYRPFVNAQILNTTLRAP